MKMMNALIALSLVSSIVACGGDSKSKRKNHGETTVTDGDQKETPKEEPAVKPEEPKQEKRKEADEQKKNENPSAPAKVLDIVGTWTACQVSGKESVGVQYVFDNTSKLEINTQEYQDRACQKPKKSSSRDTIKASFTVGAELEAQAKSLDIVLGGGTAVYLAYRIEKDQLTVTHACDESQKGKCQPSGFSADSRSTDFDDEVTVLNRK